MTEVTLHIYDVTNSGNDKTDSTIMQINKIFKDGIGLGGIFHSAIQVYGDQEWSFGYCDHGTGVFNCPSTKNPMYTYRESIKLGETSFSISKVNQILRELSREWPGQSYDLLAKNCNHFCDEFCERLGVPKLPGWVNRFANAGDTAIEIAENTANRFRQAKTEIVSASKVAYRFLAGVASTNSACALDSTGNSDNSSPIFQSTWFKNFMYPDPKPPTSSELENQEQEVTETAQQQGHATETSQVASDNSVVAPDSTDNSHSQGPRFQGTWFENLDLVGAKPSSSSEVESLDKDVVDHQQRQRQDAEAPLKTNPQHDIADTGSTQ